MSDSFIAFSAIFLFLVFLGLPVAWSMLVSSIAWMGMTDQWNLLPLLPERIYQGVDVFVLMAIPLFILAGELVNEGKITERLVSLANLLFGWMRGGLAQVNIGASMLFSGMTGVALGDVAALGRIFIPAMVRQGYLAPYAAAVTATSSIIGPMVPPSLVIVLYGSMTELSIGALFAACVIPGILIGVVLMLVVAVQARLYGFPRVEVDRSPRTVVRTSQSAIAPLMIPVILVGGIVFGVMTPTEAGGVAALYALILSMLFYRSISVHHLPAIFGRSMHFTGQLMIILACGAMFSWVVGMEDLPARLRQAIQDSQLTSIQLMLIFNAFLLVLGMFLDIPTIVVLFAPILSIGTGC